jgi:hypothetical protein
MWSGNELLLIMCLLLSLSPPPQPPTPAPASYPFMISEHPVAIGNENNYFNF